MRGAWIDGDWITAADVAEPGPACPDCEELAADGGEPPCDACHDAAWTCRRCGGRGCDVCNGVVGLFADVR